MRKLLRLVLISSALLVLFLSLANANTVVNGGFETGDSTGWSVLLGPVYGNTYTKVLSSSPDGITPFDGKYFASFSNFAPEVSGFSQTVSTTPGQVYVLTSWFTNAINSDKDNEFKITWDGTVLLDQTGFAYNSAWQNFSFQVTGSGSDVIAFSGYQNRGWDGLDDVSLQPATVPEPTSLLLLGSGLGAIGLAAWRKRK